MTVEGKNVAIFVANEYEDLEAWYPYLRLKEAGVNVTIIASDNVEGNVAKSKHVIRLK